MYEYLMVGEPRSAEYKAFRYNKRLIDAKIESYLSAVGAICIEGPKWCGKTFTGMYHSAGRFFVADPSNNFQNRRLTELSITYPLEGETPLLIDEWQEVPALWDAVRFEVDARGKTGQFILTGSSTPTLKGIMHSGAGRIASIKMRTMSLFETGDSEGVVSLRDNICKNQLGLVKSKSIRIQDLAYLIVRGGWPAVLNSSSDRFLTVAKDYINAVVRHDFYRLDGIDRDGKKMELLLRSLARHESTTASIKTLIKDIKETDDENITAVTISGYLNVLERLFLIENQEPFVTNLRSSVRLKKMEKRHFTDPSLAAALLGASPEDLIGDINTMGLLFEALCVRDLKIYGDTFDAKVMHYQDYKGREIDAVVAFGKGDWVAIEIKLGENQVDEAAEKLIKLSRSIEQEGGRKPKALCVLCGLSSAAYTRKDGVMVVPITALRN